MYDRYFIGPQTHGQEKNLKPFMIPDQAYASLKNAYLFRGRVRKRFGERFMLPATGVTAGYETLTSRLRLLVVDAVNVPVVTNGAGNLAATVVPGAAGKIGQLFSVTGDDGLGNIGTDLFTVITDIAPFNLLSNRVGATGTFDTATGTLTLAGSRINTNVYFYPSEPVMGLITDETRSVNDEQLYAFDTRFSYVFDAVGFPGWSRLGTGIWTGGNADFFWGETWRAADSSQDTLYVTNFVDADGIQYRNAAVPNWLAMPNLDFNAAGDTIVTSRIIIAFKNRMLLLNTREMVAATGVTTTFQNRCRFSQNGSPLAATAWRQDVPGQGGFIDLPTQEAIVTAQHLRDRLIVYCDRSTWELVYTGNQILPFVWQQINTELGAESTFSQVPFDQVVLGVGNVGVHACDGSSVTRIDDLIPNEVFEIHNENNGLERVAGIRDYYTEHAYWTFPTLGRTSLSPYPDSVLAYNYAAQTWATFDDTITAWGYTQQGNTQNTWAKLTGFTWAAWGGTWAGANSNSKNRNIVAGNQQGFTFIVDPDKATNAPALQITDIVPSGPDVSVVVKEHNLKVGDFVLVENCQGATELNDLILRVSSVSATSADELTLYYDGVVFLIYTGGGTLTKVSRIDILTKQYNFYMDQGKNIYVAKVDFNVDKTTDGLILVDFSTSSTGMMMSEEARATGCLLGNYELETSPYALVPLEQQQSYVWHPVYFQAEGECIQLRLYFDDPIMSDKDITSSDFQLNAMLFYTQGISRLQ